MLAGYDRRHLYKFFLHSVSSIQWNAQNISGFQLVEFELAEVPSSLDNASTKGLVFYLPPYS